MEAQPESVQIHNLNSQYFASEQGPNKLVITYLDNGMYRGFFRNSALPSNAVSTCRVRLAKTTDNWIMTGIATNAVFGQVNCQLINHRECYAYSSSGSLFEGTYGKEVGRAVSNGEVIAVQVDTANWQIKWTVGQQQLAAAVIPEEMRCEALYFVVIMWHKNDVVEMLMD